MHSNIFDMIIWNWKLFCNYFNKATILLLTKYKIILSPNFMLWWINDSIIIANNALYATRKITEPVVHFLKGNFRMIYIFFWKMIKSGHANSSLFISLFSITLQFVSDELGIFNFRLFYCFFWNKQIKSTFSEHW